ncbi:Serine/threonine-protein kinase spk-1 [Tolypocladium ophioglossoides CBS 100239]|uniref:Serine/threonine-protein kinase spk-1 n=1 Tax=Tolypocladium ophioglossoides (strain CBS 100239) TaxID=1163406 RepID=A0A0L0NFE0_TOLOC|nr:Serine/threonine-protein kinase spk-1 [Tolypocladium ophioglossoides CBS 100239]
MHQLQIPPSPGDQFFYVGGEAEFENMLNYKRHGSHPVILGDILPKPSTCVSDPAKKPRYRIIMKLGFGAFCTGWLARDLVENRYVAVKVCLGSDTAHENGETEILSQLHETGRGKHGYERVIQLFDAFIIEGPNGFHECLVTEVVAPLSDYDVQRWCSSETIRQIIEGFAFLHEQGIAHGDPHNGNFGIAVPELEQFDEEAIAEYVGGPDTIPVVPIDPSLALHSLPPYLVERLSIVGFLQEQKSFPTGSEMSVRIMDFGRSYRTSEKVPSLPGAAPYEIRPPEVAMHDLSKGKVGSIWSEAADIWAVGCTLYHIRRGGELISTGGSANDRLFHAVDFGGPPPQDWPELWNDGRKTLRPFNRVKAWEETEANCSDEKRKFLDLIKKMIVTKPDERSPMAELLTHPFVQRRSSNGC